MLLIDADLICYTAAWVAQKDFDWGEEVTSQSLDKNTAFSHMEDNLEYAQDMLKDNYIICCFSSKNNWRKEIYPEYKANRKDKPKPELLNDCIEYLKNKYPAFHLPRLEADDVMGILATTHTDSVIVSTDKDMKTIPKVKIFNYNKEEDHTFETTDRSAYIFHMTQTLTGDPTDGYAGIPGIGPKKAEAIIEQGLTDSKQWKKKLWRTVIEAYKGKGLKQEDAILNARLANILTKKQYNLKTHEMKLWRP